jgi:DNA (cytosine-5)-methyltransferase 1
MNDIFSFIYPKYKITKPIRLIELFAGYGSQNFALKYLNANYEHYKIVEWAVPSIQAYKDAHFKDDDIDYSDGMTDDEVIGYLSKKGISRDYNEPMTLEQIKRLKNQRTIYNNIIATDNLVNITTTKGIDLEIVDTDKYEYIMTYSFPCQDLSLAGLRKGMSDTSTRSGMLWEVERILKECENKPQILLMENVPQVIGAKNVEHFNKWQLELERMGYKNYHQNLIATDYGIPQTRNRTFMISILGDYNYSFPQPIPLKLKLKDLLEDNVDEKYYLSKNAIKGMLETNFQQSKYETRVQKEVCSTIMARDYKDAKCVEMNNIMPTMTTRPDCLGVVVGTYQFSKSDNFMKGKDRLQLGKETSDTIQTTTKEGIAYSNLRIRKLTPKECFRLMGVKDEDYERIAKNQSDSSLYHLAGDSIVVNVLMAIFKELL